MNQQYEIEFKNILTKEQYEQLLNRVQHSKTIKSYDKSTIILIRKKAT